MKRFLLLLFILFCLVLSSGGEEPPKSQVTYLYLPACQSCAKVSSLLDSLGDEVRVESKEGIQTSRLIIEKADISQDPALAESLFARYQVPENQQIVPAVYFGTRYLVGAEQILSLLPQALVRGEALTASPEPSSSHEAQAPALNLSASIGAGLIAGLNPCALSMLILLLGSIMHLGRRSAKLAAVYLLTKLITYFLIGWVLLKILQAWNPVWLTTAIKLLLTGLAGALILLNILDAWRSYKGEYGKLKNQLPSSLRQKLQSLIRRIAASPFLVWGMVVLGIAVSIGEFLCAGQLYLANLLFSINAGTRNAQQLIMLFAYCLAFILPSTLLTLIILQLRHTLAVSDFIRRHMPLIKLLTALIMALAVIYAWKV